MEWGWGCSHLILRKSFVASKRPLQRMILQNWLHQLTHDHCPHNPASGEKRKRVSRASLESMNNVEGEEFVWYANWFSIQKRSSTYRLNKQTILCNLPNSPHPIPRSGLSSSLASKFPSSCHGFALGVEHAENSNRGVRGNKWACNARHNWSCYGTISLKFLGGPLVGVVH